MACQSWKSKKIALRSLFYLEKRSLSDSRIRAGQGRAGQERTGKDRTGQDGMGREKDL